VWTLDNELPIPCWRRHPSPSGVRMAFSTRRGGASDPPYDSLNLGRSTPDRPEAVEENRRRLLASLGLDPARLATVGQVHGADVAVTVSAGFRPACDAIVTRVPGLALAVSSADCLPILYVASGIHGAAVAAAHAGWRGTAARISVAALRSVCEVAGAETAAVRVHFGPGIRDCCYEVGPDVAARFPRETLREHGEHLYLSVPAAARLQLLEAGVPAEGIEDTEACTACQPHWYYSHRRDRGVTGRHWGIIGLLPNAV